MAHASYLWIFTLLSIVIYVDGGAINPRNPLHGIDISFQYSDRSDLEYVVETNCTSSCQNVKDGVYDSCKSCFHFTLCKRGQIQNSFECADNLYWDDEKKDCVKSTSTCSMHQVLPSSEPITEEYEPKEVTRDYEKATYVPEEVTRGYEKATYVPEEVTRGYEKATSVPEETTHGYEKTTSVPDETTRGYEKATYVPEEITSVYENASDAPFNVTKEPDFVTVVTETPEETTTEVPERAICISDCTGVKNGDHQSCLGCSVYATCANGFLYDARPCPASLVWDDSVKACLGQSTTCKEVAVPKPATTAETKSATTAAPESATTAAPESATTAETKSATTAASEPATTASPESATEMSQPAAQDACIRSCRGIPDGDYHSCLGCDRYATCLLGVFIDNRRCSKDLVWDNIYKMCLSRSQTCKSSKICIEGSCRGVPDGDYQSCHGCGYYSTCLMGVFIDERQCMKGSVWDNKYKICLTSSNTCEYGRVSFNEEITRGYDDATYFPEEVTRGYENASDAPLDVTNNFVTVVTEAPKETSTEVPERSICISDCTGVKNGDHQSCLGCSVYATCANGFLYDARPCPASLVWDDSVKACRGHSTTCEEVAVPKPATTAETKYVTTAASESATTADPEPATTASPESATEMSQPTAQDACIRSCRGIPDGDYHSCLGCDRYATCLLGVFIDDRRCSKDLVWDSIYKMCLSRSQTCKSSKICIEGSCRGVPDGDYQSCHGCGYYSTCLMGVFIDERQCMKGSVWDNKYKICLTSSNTCEDDRVISNDPSHPQAAIVPQLSTATPDVTMPEVTTPEVTTPDEVTPETANCVSKCSGMPDGNFQSCKGCNVFASCSGGRLIDSRPCPANLVWDDMVKQCLHQSSTCHA